MATKEELEKLPTLSVGQCCDLKSDDGKTRLWVCRGTGEVSVEQLTDGRWTIVKGH
jgi:hypothetical protein